MTAGGIFQGTTDDAAIRDDYGNGLTTGCPSGGAGSGKDVAYLLSPSTTTRYTVIVTPLTSNYDPMLYVQATCGAGACLAGTVFNGAGQPETVTFTITGGTSAYIIVDGEVNTRGPFELTISGQLEVPDAGTPDAGAPDAGMSDDGGTPFLNGGDTCAMAPDVTAGGTFLGTTDDAAIVDDYSAGPGAGCPSGGSGSGRDVAYLLHPFNTTSYTVTVTPLRATFNPMLYVQTACGPGACLAGTVLNGFGQPETVTFTVNGGVAAYVIVDGEVVSRGPFEITITPH